MGLLHCGEPTGRTRLLAGHISAILRLGGGAMRNPLRTLPGQSTREQSFADGCLWQGRAVQVDPLLSFIFPSWMTAMQRVQSVAAADRTHADCHQAVARLAPCQKRGVALYKEHNRTAGPGIRANPLTASLLPELSLRPRAGIEASSLSED